MNIEWNKPIEAFAKDAVFPATLVRYDPGRAIIKFAFAGGHLYLYADDFGATQNLVDQPVIPNHEISGFLIRNRCEHDHLDEDGICRQCGADRRGIGGGR